ncbi:MAG: ROK family protein [Ruminococcaceae bacterium]|nr:ROK family protein [Oscillospiraceae bacterium]
MYYIGIDLGGTNIAVGLVDENGKILHSDSVPTLKERHWSEIVKDMADLSLKVLAESGHTLDEIKAVGIGCPGSIDKKNGVVVYSNNIVMDHVPMAEEIRKYIDLPVFLENDANAAALGEYAIYGEGVESYVFMTLGTGVGGGIILNGKVWSGFNGAGAEIGHQSLVFGGKPCTCGRRGCLEAYASVTALIAQTTEAIEQNPDSLMAQYAKEKGKVNGRTSFECAKMGDPVAIAVRDRYIEYVAEGICSIVNVLQPEILAIGGGISREGDTLLNPIKEYFATNDYNKHMKKTDIRIARLFGDAGIVGAAKAAEAGLEG